MRIARSPHRARRLWAALLFSAALSLAAGAVLAAAPADKVSAKAGKPQNDAQVERLTDLVVQAIPMGMIFDSLSEADPNWPMQEKPDAVTPAQLGCLRRELSADGYRRTKREDAAAYIEQHPSSLEQDIRVLDEGAALMMGKLMLAGVEQERTGIPVDQNALMGQASPEQLAAFMSFMTSPDHASLRRLAGIGNAFDHGRSAEENENAGEAAGADLATRIMLKAMGRCEVPSSVLFE